MTTALAAYARWGRGLRPLDSQLPLGEIHGVSAQGRLSPLPKIIDVGHEDENSVLGPQDGNVDTGFFSLNGGHIVVSFQGEEEVQCGDSLSVVVMENSERSDYYRVYAGPTEDGPWWRFASAATGTTEVVVEWEW